MESMAARFSLPEDLAPGVPRVTLTGGREVRVENQRCLLSFSSEEVEIGCGKLRLRIRGSDLLLRGMEREELWITGTICSVEVEGG